MSKRAHGQGAPPAPPIDYAHFEGIPSPNGTIVPDIVLDWIMPDLSNAELRVLLYIIRRTLGFKKDADAISIDQICNGLVTREGRAADGTVVRPAQRLDRGTGLSRSTALDAARSLREKNLIVGHEQFDPRYGQQPTRYALNLRAGALGAPAGDGGGGGPPGPPGPPGRTSPIRDVGQGGSDYSDGGGPIDRTPGVHQTGRGGSDLSDPQTTVDKTTVDQKTDISNRKARAEVSADMSDSSDSISGQGSVTDDDTAVGTGSTGRDNDATTDAVDAVVARVSALGAEFGDDAPRASASRIATLRRAPELDDDALLGLLDEAAAITRSQAHAIIKRGRGGRPVRMPYLLRTLESLVDPAGGRVPRASPPASDGGAQDGGQGDGMSRAHAPVGGARGRTDRATSIDEPDAVWRAALGELRTMVTADNYDTWLATTQVVTRTDEVLRIGALAPFQREWLERRLHRRVRDALDRIGHGRLRVEYVVAARPGDGDGETAADDRDPPAGGAARGPAGGGVAP